MSGCGSLPILSSAPAGDGPQSAAKPDYVAGLKASRQGPIRLGGAVPPAKVRTDVQALAAEAIAALNAGRLEDASQLLNTALRMDLGNASLQFMNALTYHLMAINGDAQKFALAEQGYELAYKFDPTSVLSVYYRGLALLDQRKFEEAKGAFAVAAVMEEGDGEILYDLARAAYYAGDPRTARAALAKLAALHQGQVAPEKIARAEIVTDAALGDMASAKRLLQRFKERLPEEGEHLARRVGAWERLYTSAMAPGAGGTRAADADRPQLAQVLPGAGIPVIPGAAAPAGAREAGGPRRAAGPTGNPGTDMTVVDVVIVGTQEDVSDTQGLNLLSGLQLQFGEPLTRTPGFSASRNIVDDRMNTGNNVLTRTVTRLISIPAVTYSLNIFNSLAGRNEILARPSLVALANERSEFFAGVDVVGAAVSGGAGAPVSINKQIGVKLSIVPEFLGEDRIKLKVEAERTFITAPSRSVVFDFRLDTSKTTVNSNVVMRFGETLVLGGLTEKDTQTTRDATPILGDIPIIQYLFARKATTEFRKSVLILITPRRAQFTNQSAEERGRTEAQMSEFEKSVETFEARNRNWFVPRSVLAETVASVEGNRLFQEFKTGDFALERWNTRDTHEKRLGVIRNFLFY